MYNSKKIVNESLEDILKPKSEKEIKDSIKDIIFWRNIIDGKLSPDSLKYYLSKSFILELKKQYNINFPIKTKTDKKILHIYDLFKTRNNDSLEHLTKNGLEYALALWKNGNIDSNACMKRIQHYINNEFHKFNKKYYKITGKGLRE